ncbi:MAG TPA: galactose oxidase-like domain-containing protein [Candidatus Acidoferrum sp.]
MNTEPNPQVRAFILHMLGGFLFRFCSVILLVVCSCAHLNGQNPATTGQWSALFSTAYEPTHVVMLPNGKVLFWSIQGESLYPQLWDPTTGITTPTPLPGYQLFCAGQSFLGNNQVLVTGGNLGDFVGVPFATLYDFVANTWTRVPDMNAGRWYPTNTTLANGDVLVISGEINNSAGVNTLPQVWQAATQRWRDLTTAQLALSLYPRMFLAPNGKVFYATPESPSRYLDTSATGSWTPVANLNLNFRDYDTVVLYDVGKVLVAGGGDPPTATAEVIDLNAASPGWRYVGSMARARRQLNGTILADGKVLITGGSSGSGFDNASSPVYLTEMWDPASEQFTPMASFTKYRGYHSTAVLLPDGRVLSAGGDVGGATAEIFSPPYLFKGTRPTISGAPSTINYGQTFPLTTPDAANTTQVNLIRLSSVTHSFNQDQRINRLSFSISSGSLNITAPANGNLAPPGPYMIFILNGSGVPSVAQIVQLTADLPPVAAANATPTSGPAPLSVSFSSSGSRDPDGSIATYSWDFGDGQTSTQSNPTHTYISTGTYAAKLSLTDNSGSTGSVALFITATVVNPPPPMVSAANPSSGTRGATVTAVVTGTNFQSGATCGFGSGINARCTFDSPTQLTGHLSIDAAAPVGNHDVTVVNPDLHSGTLPGGFLVNPLPAPTSVTPNSGSQGQLITVVIKGNNFQNQSACSFGAGTIVNSCVLNSPTQLTAAVSIGSTAVVGPRDVTVTSPDGQGGALIGGFSVTSTATILLVQKATFSLQPTSGGTVTLTLPQATAAGHTLIVGMSFWPLDISSVTDGSGDAFTRGLTTSIYHNVAGSATYSNFYYAKSTAGGTTALSLNFSGGSTYLLVAVAEVAGLDPTAPLDQSGFHESLTATATWSSAAVTTTAANEYLFSWAASEASNATCASPATGWVIESQTNPATVCLLDRIVSATGSYQASVTDSAAQNYAMEIVTFKGGSSPPPPPPSASSVNPNSGAQGQSLPSVVITGGSFQSGATCSFGAGIAVNSCALNSPTQLTASITISSTATLGTRHVTVTNPDSQTGTLPNGFTVTTAGPPPPPTVSSVNPNSGAQGRSLPSVIITGSNFQSGATCSFGAGITVSSCAFNSPTQLTASITINSTATLGTRNVTVTNPDSHSNTLPNGFSVTAPSAISLIQKATFSREPTSGGTVTLTLPQATGAGHAIIVGLSFWPLDISSVTDGSGDTFTRGLATSIYHNVSGSATYTNFYYAKSTAGGTTALTLNFSGGSTYLLVAVAEVAGLDPSAPLDQSGFHESLTATIAWSSAAVTTTAANEYLFSWAATEASNPTCASPATGWIIQSQTNDSTGATVCLLDRIVSATGSYQASVTASSARDYVMELATFKGN